MRLAAEQNTVGHCRQQAGECAQQRRLAGAVGADQADHLTPRNGDIDTEQGLEIAVEGVEIFRLQQAHAARSSIPR